MTKDYNYQGYKISNSHVRLGSKIHIQDFYYASRMFQHSYFANRFAILIARYIINLVHKQGLKGKKLVIVGYGKYSELLVVRVMKILELRSKVTELDTVNYEIIGDTEVPSLLRQHKFTSQERILFLIPVGSTLSTGIKMRNFLLKDPEVVAANIIEPFVNILLATDGLLDAARLELFKKNESDILSQYGWNNIDLEQKIIHVNTLDNEEPAIVGKDNDSQEHKPVKTTVEQKFFIALESKWHNIHNCELCFPHHPDTKEADYAKEHPLIETDRASVTPQLILNDNFDFSGEELNLNKDEDKVILDPGYHYYGHQFYGGNEHFHFIKPSEFLEKHYEQVEIWLDNIAKESILDKARGCKVTLIAPEGNLNSNFTSLINERIFSNTANIIQYNTKNDFVQNFIQLYQDTIKQAEYVFYVDDLVLTGSTFHASNNFIRQCLEGKNKKSKGFDAVIALITRADDFTIRHMTRELNRREGPDEKHIYAFKHIRIPPLIYSHLECPVCKQSNLYNEIAERCVLTTLRYLFFDKSNELKVRNFPNKPLFYGPLKYSTDIPYDYKGDQPDKMQVFDIVTKIEGFFKNQHLLKLVITDLLLRPEANVYFRGNHTFNDLVNHVHEKMRQYKNIVVVKPLCREILIKCITLPPFTYHKGVKETVFRWIIEEADHFMKSTILRRNGLVSNKVTDYFYLKLLLKRLSLLKSNYLLRKRTLENILRMYASGVEEFLQRKEARTAGRKQYIIKLAGYLHEYRRLNSKPGKNSLETTLAEITAKEFSPEDLLFMEELLKSAAPAPHTLKYVHELESHIKYCVQGIQNIDTLNTTLNGYQYFIVACVKEIIHNNEAKAIKLETNINSLYKNNKPQIDRITDFYHLLRIMKLENVGIIKQFLERIQVTSRNRPEKLSLQHINFRYIEAQNKPNNYFFRPVFDLLQLENKFLQDDIKTAPYAFDLFMNVYRDLIGSVTDNSKLNTKVTSILNGILALMGLNPSSAYISLSVQVTPALSEKPKAEALTTFTNEAHFMVDIPKNSFIPTMYGGIRADINGPRQTFTELVSYQGNYVTLVDPLYDVEANRLDKQTIKEFHEIKHPKYNHLLFYRISAITSHGDGGGISDNPVGVLFIAVRNPRDLDSWYFNCERLRYLLLLQDKLISFIRQHIVNDGFRAFLEETQKLHSLTTYRHGWNTYINQILKKVEKIEGNEDKKSLLIPWIDLLLDQTRLARDLLVIQFIPDKKERLKRLEQSRYTREQVSGSALKTILFEKLKLAYSHDNSKPYSIPEVEFNHFDQWNKDFIIYKEIFSIIIHEIITNIIKYARNEADNQYIKFTLTETNGQMYLEVLNPFHEKSYSQYENRFSEGRGIKMILEIYRKIFDLHEVEIGPSEKDKTFLVKLPLNVEE